MKKTKKTRPVKKRKLRSKDSKTSKHKRNTPDSSKLKKRKELMKWLTVKEDKDNSWTWWLKLLSKTTKLSKSLRTRESLPNTLPEKKLKWKMRTAEKKSFINRNLPLRITLFNRLGTKRWDSRKKLKEIRFKLQSGRKKLKST